jgi:2Fe-2S ferredoxin
MKRDESVSLSIWAAINDEARYENKKMPKITFVFQGQEKSGEFDSTTSLLSAAQQLGVPIISTCGGQPSCTDCRVKVLEGIQHLCKPEFEEINLMGSVSHITGIRLSCQAKATQDVKAEVLRIKGSYDKQEREAKQRKRQERYLENKRQEKDNRPTSNNQRPQQGRPNDRDRKPR